MNSLEEQIARVKDLLGAYLVDQAQRGRDEIPMEEIKHVQAGIECAVSLLRTEAAPGWQPIETAPKDTDVIVTNGVAVGEARFYEDADKWFWAGSHPTDFQDGEVHMPTLWQPLPVIPSATPNSPSVERETIVEKMERKYREPVGKLGLMTAPSVDSGVSDNSLRGLIRKIDALVHGHFSSSVAHGPVQNLLDHLSAIARCHEINSTPAPNTDARNKGIEEAAQAIIELPYDFSGAINGHVEHSTMTRCVVAIRALKSPAEGETK